MSDDERRRKLLESIMAAANPFGNPFSVSSPPRPAATTQKPAKVSCEIDDENYVAVGMTRAVAYAETRVWRRVATIKSNGKPIAILFCFASEGVPWHPEQ